MQSVLDVTCEQMWINCENQLNIFFLAPPMCSSAVSKETQIYIKWAPRVKTCLMHLRTTKAQTSLCSLISAIVIQNFIEKYHI